MPDPQPQVAPILLALDKSAEGRAAAAAALQALDPTATVVEAASQTEAERGWRGPLPKLAVVAFELDGQNGLDAAQRILKLSPSTKVIVYAASMPESVRRALAELGSGFMNAPATGEKILNALDCCAAERALASRVAARLAFA